MSWRDSHRKQMSKYKSRQVENKITEEINRRNKIENEKLRKDINDIGRSLYYSSGENDDSYCDIEIS